MHYLKIVIISFYKGLCMLNKKLELLQDGYTVIHKVISKYNNFGFVRVRDTLNEYKI